MAEDGKWWAKFEDRHMPEPNSGCWIWTGFIQDGVPKLGQRTVRRVLLEARTGQAIPAGSVAVPSCGMQLCVNPDHVIDMTWAARSTANATVNIGPCSQDGCDRPSRYKGMCNAHYLRSKGASARTGSIRVRDPSRDCRVPGCASQHYGLGLCRAHYGMSVARLRKISLVKMHGGSCCDCGGTYHHSAMDFHHIDPAGKSGSVSTFTRGDMSDAINEAAKCELICANCHRIRHSSIEIDQYLETKNG